jgi:hypothetical protein
MTKYYLYFLLGVFIYINGVGYFNNKIRYDIRQKELLNYKLRKQKLYSSHIEDIKKILSKQKVLFEENKRFFFEKEKKETIVFSEIQQNTQNIFRGIGGKIKQLNSGVLIENQFYKKYPITLSFDIIPEDLDKFLKRLYKNKKYLFIDSIHIVANKRDNILNVKITLIGYQLK